MRGRRFFFSLALGMALVSQAHASEPGRVTLRWSAPADCPTEETVLAEVDRLLGARAPSDEPILDVVAEVRQKDDGAYVVRLEIPGTDGPRVREVSALSCAALGQATALILAMMIDPEAALTAPPNPGPRALEPPIEPPQSNAVEPGKTAADLPPPPRPAGPVSKTQPAKPTPRKIVKAHRPPLSAVFHLVEDVGSLPKSTFGFGGAIGVMPGSWKFEAGATYFLAKSSSFSAIPNAGARVDLLDVHLASGRVITPHPKIDFIPRIRFDMGRFRATSFGVSEVDQGSSYSFGLGVDSIVSVHISKYVRTRLELDGIWPLVHPRFIVTGLGIAHEPSSFVWRIALGTEVQF